MIRAGAVVQSNVAPYHYFIVLTSPNAADEVLPLNAAVLQRLQAEAKASGRLPPAWIDDLP